MPKNILYLSDKLPRSNYETKYSSDDVKAQTDQGSAMHRRNLSYASKDTTKKGKHGSRRTSKEKKVLGQPLSAKKEEEEEEEKYSSGFEEVKEASDEEQKTQATKQSKRIIHKGISGVEELRALKSNAEDHARKITNENRQVVEKSRNGVSPSARSLSNKAVRVLQRQNIDARRSNDAQPVKELPYLPIGKPNLAPYRQKLPTYKERKLRLEYYERRRVKQSLENKSMDRPPLSYLDEEVSVSPRKMRVRVGPERT